MFYDLRAMNLSGFDVRAVPHTAAKAQQQAHSLRGTEAWLYHVLQEGWIGCGQWQNTGLEISTDLAYRCYEDFSERQHAWRPEIKAVWSKKVRSMLGHCVADTRQKIGNRRDRAFKFAPLSDCRCQFATHAGAPNIEWESASEDEEFLPLPARPQSNLASRPSQMGWSMLRSWNGNRRSSPTMSNGSPRTSKTTGPTTLIHQFEICFKGQ